MRDLQHWKDKVELSLDGRQVFFLFFGGAVLACMLFALGLMTGRRLEARAIALDTPSAEDPLAALDQLGDLEDEELTYHRALTKDSRGNLRSKETVATHAESESDAPMSTKPSAKPAVVSPPRPAPAIGKPAPSPGVTALPSKPASASAEPSALPVAPVAVRPLPVLRPTVAANPLKGEAKEGAAEPAQPHFTLQLSAFAARRDADDFMHRVQTAGYRAFVVSSDVPGKGVMYRVRVGDYASKDAAMAEKGAVEKKLKVAAYLAKL